MKYMANVKLGDELTWCYTLQTKRKFNRLFYRLRVITGQTIRRGKVSGSVCLRWVFGLRVAYSYSLYFSEQLSCINYFHRSYGLKYIDF